jgi:hypothetical protein
VTIRARILENNGIFFEKKGKKNRIDWLAGEKFIKKKKKKEKKK